MIYLHFSKIWLSVLRRNVYFPEFSGKIFEGGIFIFEGIFQTCDKKYLFSFFSREILHSIDKSCHMTVQIYGQNKI
jgi:hypothetical protein